MRLHLFAFLLTVLLLGCTSSPEVPSSRTAPDLITTPVPHDSEDPAIWVHPSDPNQSLVLVTDKEADGGIYVFNLDGERIAEKTIHPVARPNNIDVTYHLPWGDTTIDVAVYTERLTEKLRVFRLPDMTFVDGGGVPLFEGQGDPEFRAPMGVACFTDLAQNAHYAVVSRKNGPTDSTYLWQYRLYTEGDSIVRGALVRQFGAFSGAGEIEAIGVDDTLGVLYYSDEGAGIRKYWAHPDSSGRELALFGTDTFQEDREGIALLSTGPGKGYLVISDQQAHRFLLFPREGTAQGPHHHPPVGAWNLSTIETDGCELHNGPLGTRWPHGLFVAMSEEGVYHYYDPGKLQIQPLEGQSK